VAEWMKTVTKAGNQSLTTKLIPEKKDGENF
jgi:hypothetical protein